MAKFQIAFCILLVACGAKALNSTAIAEQIEEQVEAIKTALEEKITRLEDAKTNATAAFATWLSEQREKIETGLSKLDAKKEELEAKAANITACASYSFPNSTTVVEKILSIAVNCVINAIAEIVSNYKAVESAIEDLQTEITTIGTSAAECVAANDKDAAKIVCLLELAGSEVVTVVSTSTSLSVKVVTLISDVYNIRNTIESCVVDSAVETAVEGLNDYLVKLQACIDDANTSE